MVREREPSTTVELPTSLVREAERLAEQQQWDLSHALAYLLNRGISAQQETERAVTDAYNTFMSASAEQRDEAGKALMRSVFGQSSIA